MALENADLLVIQKADGARELRKVTVEQLLADIDVDGGAEVIISDDAPDFAADNLEPGTLWWSSSEGDLFILYKDPADNTQWVSATAGGGGSGSVNPPRS